MQFLEYSHMNLNMAIFFRVVLELSIQLFNVWEFCTAHRLQMFYSMPVRIRIKKKNYSK